MPSAPQLSPAVLKGIGVYLAIVIILGVTEVALLGGNAYWVWVVLFVFTLPWSVVPWLMTWALMHSGITAWGIVGVAILFAGLNSALALVFYIRRANRGAVA
jgi:hypothetical protein